MNAEFARDMAVNAAVFGFFASGWFGWAQDAPPRRWRPFLITGSVLSLLTLAAGVLVAWRHRDDGTVFDTCEYHPSQVERIARRAFALAGSRGGALVSVDKANVLETSRMWRRVVDEVAAAHPGIHVRHALVDSFAMEIVTSPERIDVVVTENTFGDILSDIAAAVTGGLGLAASASLGDDGPGIFEPVHGSAPDIAGAGIANPSAMLRSVALLLEHGLGRLDLAAALDAAVDTILVARPTRDAGGSATTGEFGDAVLAELEQALLTAEAR